ncbi:MAG: 1-phosphofructokinase family hexose kinase [Candidatus Hodarchaeota archaeon]
MVRVKINSSHAEELKVLTVTLNPALDRTVYLPFFNPGKTNLVYKSTVEAGGKGVNVSKALNQLEISNCATGVLPAWGANIYLRSLHEMGVTTHFLQMENGQVRENIKIIEESSGTLTELNEKGNQVSRDTVLNFLDLFHRIIPNYQAIALSGSLAPGIPFTMYRQLIEIATTMNLVTALDCSESALQEALISNPPHPTIVHINRHELKALNVDFKAKQLFEWIQHRNIQWFVITDGAKSGWAVCPEKVYRFTPPIIKAVSPVASGDALTAALIQGCLQRKTFDESLRLAIAFATATALCPGSTISTLETALSYCNEVRIKPELNDKT